MPLEECRHVYLGTTAHHVYVYLGNASASLAAFLYDTAGVDFHTEKTDIVLSVDDFAYLVNVDATVFKRKPASDIVRDLKTILEAYDIFRENNMMLPPDATRPYAFPVTDFYHGTDQVLYNSAEKVAIFLEQKEMPEYIGDSIITCSEWMNLGDYEPTHMQQHTVTGDKVGTHMRAMFHKQRFEHYIDLRNKLRGFKDLFINTIS